MTAPTTLVAVAPKQPKPRASYQWWVGEMRTGLLTGRLLVRGDGASWQTVLNGAGQLQVTVPLTEPTARRLNLYTSAEPCRTFLAVAYTDDQGTERWLAGGPIWTHQYDDDTGQLTIGAAGLWSLWDHRFVLPVLTAGQSPAGVSSTFTGSLGQIAKQLVVQAQAATGGQVPVVLPDDETGSNTRTWPGYQLTTVGEALTNLTGVQNGPEIAFEPQRSTTDPRCLEWVMRVGTAAQPMLTQGGNDWMWDASVVKGAISGISVQRDGQGIAERVFVQGAGTDTGTAFSNASDNTLLNAGFPLMEVLDSAHSGDNGAEIQATLDAYAAADLATAHRAAETWTATVRRDETPKAGTYRCGDYASIKIGPKHRYLPQGAYRSRIVQISGDMTRAIQLQLQTTTES